MKNPSYFPVVIGLLINLIALLGYRFEILAGPAFVIPTLIGSAIVLYGIFKMSAEKRRRQP